MGECSASWQAAVLGLCLTVPALAAAAPSSAGREAKPATIYRCDNNGATSYSDVQQRCVGGTITAPRTVASGVIVSGPVARVSLPGPPCPLPVAEPEGAPWAGVRACYTAALMGQPSQRLSESHLAGLIMGQCEAETQKLAQAKTFTDELGSAPDERRVAIRRWALWLVQQSGAAYDTTPVQVVTLGRASVISRLSGPLEVQLADGTLMEGFNGTLVRPGQQLYVRKNISLLLGGSPVAAQAQRDRCVRLD